MLHSRRAGAEAITCRATLLFLLTSRDPGLDQPLPLSQCFEAVLTRFPLPPADYLALLTTQHTKQPQTQTGTANGYGVHPFLGCVLCSQTSRQKDSKKVKHQ